MNERRYEDGRPQATLRLNAVDEGVVLRHGAGAEGCDALGAREALVCEDAGVYHLFYDGAGPRGWRACLAVSRDLRNWERRGPILELGAPGSLDSAAATSPWVIHDGREWHMFYLGTPCASAAPEYVPSFPYCTLKAHSQRLAGPWQKQPEIVPFSPQPGTYYSDTASPGHVVKRGDEYLMFFSASMPRTLGIARTRDLNGAWSVDTEPILPPAEQIENSSLYYEQENGTWFLFTNHVGIENGVEYTDAVWVYWTCDLEHWDARNKAVVLDGENCTWSRKCIGMPSVIRVGNKLAVMYDAPGGDSISHMRRDIGLAWLALPLNAPG